MATRTIRVKGKRVWSGYSLPGEPGWNRPGGGDGDTASPRERSMHSVRLRQEDESLSRRRDQTRQRNQRKMFWYIQWSRDWRVRQLAAPVSIQPEKAWRVGNTGQSSEDINDANQTQFVWSWGEYCKARRKLKRGNGIPKQVSSLLQWVSSLNQAQHCSKEQRY